MSATGPVKAITVPDIMARKGTVPLVCLTAYTTPVAALSDASSRVGGSPTAIVQAGCAA